MNTLSIDLKIKLLLHPVSWMIIKADFLRGTIMHTQESKYVVLCLYINRTKKLFPNFKEKKNNTIIEKTQVPLYVTIWFHDQI